MSLVSKAGRVRRTRRSAWRNPIVFTTLGLVACGGDSSGPGPTVAPVQTVQVAGPSNSIEVGETIQLTATALDANGNVLTGRAFTWTSTNQAVADVDASGLVVGQTTGNATINATAEGKSGAFSVTVVAPTIPTIGSITPGTLVPGQAATIEGANFSVSTANNKVTVGGVPASVIESSATSIRFNVPITLCAPDFAAVLVTVNGRSSSPVNWPAEKRGDEVNLAVGKQMIASSLPGNCLQFPASQTAQEYVIGVQSTAESVNVLTSVAPRLTATGNGGPPLAQQFSTAAVSPVSVTDRTHAAWWHRQRATEMAFRTRERAETAPFMPELVRNRTRAGPGSADAVAGIPITVAVGQTLSLRVPDRNATGPNALCQNYADITATVKAVSTRSVWLEDNANPSGGFTTAEYNTLASQFDNNIWATDVTYFGSPSDIDGDGRVAIVVTKEVNRAGVLGFTATTDQIPRAQCASSNGGEIYYGIAVDANGAFGDVYTKASALDDAPLLIAHEFSHIIQFSVRLAQGATTESQLPAVWELEGQATLAEEVNGHAFANHVPGTNLGFEIAFNCNNPPDCTDKPTPIDWYLGGFIDLILYYGFESGTTRVPGAPELCSWLDVPSEGDTFPCLLGGREVYGVPWSLLRFISDQFGSQFAGGEAELNRQLLAGTTRGFANIQRVVGMPAATILARWSASLYADDRVTGLDDSLKMTSWNLFNIWDRLVDSAQLEPKSRSFSSFNETVMVRGGSLAYYRLSGDSHPVSAFSALAPDGTSPSSIQVWVLRTK